MAAFSATVRTRVGVRQSIDWTNGFVHSLDVLSTPTANLVAYAMQHPYNFTLWPGNQGAIYLSDGIHKVHRWNGLRPNFIPVGIETPSGTPTIAGSGSGSITGVYRIYIQFGDEDGNWGPLSTASTDTTITARTTLTFAALPRPTEGRVTRRRILRNTDGQFTTFYEDINSTDIFSTSLTSTTLDATLDNGTVLAGTAVVLFDDANTDLSGQWAAPRNDKPIMAPHKDHMFFAGEVTYKRGNAQVTFGSATVTGTGTAWTAQMADRDFMVTGQTRRYAISSVSESAQTLTLAEVYKGATDKFASYMIQPPKAQRAALFYSEGSAPEGVPTTNYVIIVETSSVITALIPTEAYLYIGFAESVFRFSYSRDPANDGEVFLNSYRGVLNQNCWQRLDNTLYCLDTLGVYILKEGDARPISHKIHDLFSRQVESRYTMDWSQADWFTSTVDPANSIVKFFVSLEAGSRPRHALCYHTLADEWFVDEYPWPIGGGAVLANPIKRVMLAGPAAKLLEAGQGRVDLLNPTGHVTEAAVTAATLFGVTAPQLVLPSAGVVNAPVCITEGKGKGQQRIVNSWTDSTKILIVTKPWTTLPDTTSRVQVGGIKYTWKSGVYEKIDTGPVDILWDATTLRSLMNVRLYVDFSATPETMTADLPLAPESDDPKSYEEDGTDTQVRTDLGNGQVTFEIHHVVDAKAKYLQLEIHGFSGPDGLNIHSVDVGAARA